MRRAASLLFCLIGIGLFGSSIAFGRVLILSFSDSHAHYGYMERFLFEVAHQREQFLRENPDGTVVLLVNGDFAGLSLWARDHGDLVYEMLEALAAHPRMELVVTLGNHDAFDFEGVEGNQLFVDQTRRLARAVERHKGRPFHVVNANLATTPLGAELIRPYRDIPTAHGIVRFTGAVLDEFFLKSGYSFTEGPQLFQRGTQPAMLAVANQQWTAAENRDVRALVVANHDVFERTVRLKRHLDRQRAEFPRLAGVALPWAFAAHDHKILVDEDSGTVDSGSDFELSAAIIENDFYRGPLTLFPRTRVVREWPDDLTGEERAFLQRMRPIVSRIANENAEVLGKTRYALPPKAQTKARPTTTGTIAANALWQWADWAAEGLYHTVDRRHEVAGRDGRRLRVVSFYNSSSVRGDAWLDAGASFTRGYARTLYPFLGSPQLFRVSGARLALLHNTLRKLRWEVDQTFTPQLSSNLLDSTQDDAPSLKILAEDGRFQAVEPNEEYLLVLDKFLSRNGYDIPAWRWAFGALPRVSLPDTPLQQEIIERYAPEWAESADCLSHMMETEGAGVSRMPGGDAARPRPLPPPL